MEEIIKKLEEYEFKRFSVGVRCKDEEKKKKIRKMLINTISKKFNATYDPRNPEVFVLYDESSKSFEVKSLPLYIYGKYNKYAPIPQTKWPCRVCKGKGCKRCNYKGKMYEETIEDLIAKPLLEVTQGEGTKFHGAGREDIDVLCIGWREFVIEVLNPKKRYLDLVELEKKINEFASGKIEVKNLTFSNKEEIRRLKSTKKSKIYRLLIFAEDIKKVLNLKEKVEEFFNNKKIIQKTPKRVLHRKGNKTRIKRVYWIKIVEINVEERYFVLEVKTESGTYVKEFVTGDENRTQPSLQGFFKTKLSVRKMIVTGFEE